MVSQQSLKKSETDIVASVTETYCLVLSLEENKISLDSNLASFEKLLFETEALYKEGFVEEINVDQLKLNVSSLHNAVNSINRSIEAVKILLKFQMGMSIDQPIELSDNLESIVSDIDIEKIYAEDFDPSQSIDYQIMDTQVRLMELDMKREKSAYLPTLAGFFSYSEKAMSDEFNFFDGDQDWYPTTLVGFQLDIPLWSSGSRLSKVQQSKLKVLKSTNTRDMVGESLRLQYTQARVEYMNAVDTYVTEKANMILSKKILDKTIIKYREGLTGSTELTQIQMQYQTGQANYFAAMYKVISARTKLNKLLAN
jgi:outer membrane protein TolC